jgi:hypothetical protein
MAGMQQPMYGQPMPQQPVVSDGMKILLYILSLIPIIGIILGAVYYTRPETKEIGKMCFIIAIIVIVLIVVLSIVSWALWWSTVY